MAITPTGIASMAQVGTPIIRGSAYATPYDLIKRYDVRVLGDLINDSGNRVSSQSILIDKNIVAVLDDASGMIDSSALVGGRYQINDLQTLSSIDQAMIIRLCCDLCFILLVQRRGLDVKSLPQYDHSMDMLQRLRTGERIFKVQGNIDKGLVTSEFVSTLTVSNRNYSTNEAMRYFPQRRQQSE